MTFSCLYCIPLYPNGHLLNCITEKFIGHSDEFEEEQLHSFFTIKFRTRFLKALLPRLLDLSSPIHEDYCNFLEY